MREPYCCTNCTTITRSSLDVARSAGWRIWDGESVTGKSMKVRICPACVGNDAPADKPSWRVGCDTCGWEWEDEHDEGALTEKDAQQMASDHECEPETWVKPPLTPEEMAEERERLGKMRARVVAVPS